MKKSAITAVLTIAAATAMTSLCVTSSAQNYGIEFGDLPQTKGIPVNDAMMKMYSGSVAPAVEVQQQIFMANEEFLSQYEGLIPTDKATRDAIMRAYDSQIDATLNTRDILLAKVGQRWDTVLELLKQAIPATHYTLEQRKSSAQAQQKCANNLSQQMNINASFILSGTYALQIPSTAAPALVSELTAIQDELHASTDMTEKKLLLHKLLTFVENYKFSANQLLAEFEKEYELGITNISQQHQAGTTEGTTLNEGCANALVAAERANFIKDKKTTRAQIFQNQDLIDSRDAPITVTR